MKVTALQNRHDVELVFFLIRIYFSTKSSDRKGEAGAGADCTATAISGVNLCVIHRRTSGVATPARRDAITDRHKGLR